MKSDFTMIGGKMGTRVKVSRMQKRGQVTIPPEIREKLHLEEGDLVAFIETTDGFILSSQEIASGREIDPTDIRPTTPVQTSVVARTAGIFRHRHARNPEDGAIDFEQARQALIEHLVRHADREGADSESIDNEVTNG